MNYTEHYELIKPGINDMVDVTEINSNMDTIDSTMYDTASTVNTLSSDMSTATGDIADLKQDISAIQNQLANIKTTYELLTFTTDLDFDDYTEPGLYYVDNTDDIDPSDWAMLKFPDYNPYIIDTRACLPFLFKVEVVCDKESGEKGVIQYISPNRNNTKLGEWAYYRYGRNGYEGDPAVVQFGSWKRNSLLDSSAEIALNGDLHLADNNTWDGEYSSLKATITSIKQSATYVVANPIDEPVTELNTIKIGDVVYKLPTGSVTTSTNAMISILPSNVSISNEGSVEE